MSASQFELHRMLQQMKPIEPLPASHADGDAQVPTIDSAALLRGHAELRIEHHGAVYRLKQTALGKLILTK